VGKCTQNRKHKTKKPIGTQKREINKKTIGKEEANSMPTQGERNENQLDAGTSDETKERKTRWEKKGKTQEKKKKVK
jgi:hypothetical protein